MNNILKEIHILQSKHSDKELAALGVLNNSNVAVYVYDDPKSFALLNKHNAHDLPEFENDADLYDYIKDNDLRPDSNITDLENVIGLLKSDFKNTNIKKSLFRNNHNLEEWITKIDNIIHNNKRSKNYEIRDLLKQYMKIMRSKNYKSPAEAVKANKDNIYKY